MKKMFVSQILKRGMDLSLASLGLIFLGLILPFVSLAIYLESPGPIFYTQKRVGKGGKIFKIIKFRTMHPGAENGQPVWTAPNDNRITKVGKFLRKTYLDELPQLINVLKGEMSLVGPRPERPEFVEILRKASPLYDQRHQVRPGMAGWALIHQGYVDSVEESLVKLEYDLYYIQHQSLWFDLKILLRAFFQALSLKGRG
jgi:lipopolysaccharide/colanic/teichoic acid biosynthesis glycosyltransferase